MTTCRGFAAARRTAAIWNTRGCAPICSDLGTSAQKCPKRDGPVPLPPSRISAGGWRFGRSVDFWRGVTDAAVSVLQTDDVLELRRRDLDDLRIFDSLKGVDDERRVPP